MDRRLSQITASLSFQRAALAVVQAAALGRRVEQFIPPDDAVTRQVLFREATPLATTTGEAFAAELAAQSFGAFLADLTPYSAAARLIAQAVSTIGNANYETTYPQRANGAAAPSFVAEGDPIPVRSTTFENVTIGPVKKLATMIPYSAEVAKRTDAEAIFTRMLREDVGAGLDTALFATTAGSATAPAGLLYGLSALPASGACSRRGAVEDDLQALGTAVAAGGSGAVTYIVRPEMLAQARIIAPDLVASVDIVASGALPAGRVVAAEGPALLVALDPEPNIESTRVGAIHMDTDPDQIGTGGTLASNVRSLWQTASVALRLIADFDFVKRRSGAAAFIDGADWNF